jgi:hypothetical protein
MSPVTRKLFIEKRSNSLHVVENNTHNGAGRRTLESDT